MKIISVVGARPNFMKISPFIKAIDDYNAGNPAEPVDHILVHTGQHYDDRMSKKFFEELNIPDADINLGIGSGTHAEQVGRTMIEFEKVLVKEKPDWVVVVGDVNATLACAVTAKKESIKLCHIEAGLRSGDISMPEEINRIVTDRLSDLLLTPDKFSTENLLREGVPKENIKLVGNIMIDTLEANREKAKNLSIDDIINENCIIEDGTTPCSLPPAPCNYAVVTLHRPSNVDSKEVLEPIINFLAGEVTKDMPIIWPIHPRTERKLKEFSLWDDLLGNEMIIMLKPLGYHEMLKLNIEASHFISDSGGLQGECSVLDTPNLVMRDTTEWLVTLTENGGNNILAGKGIDSIKKNYHNIVNIKAGNTVPELWDGNTAPRCLSAILNY